ncbi:MAG: sulfotransferase [bacterium]|nr:sulfotransferase [bacterium]
MTGPGNKTGSNFFTSHPQLEYFCTFIGYPKSGHSLVGALLDAHPNMIISHELHVLKCMEMGIKRESIYRLIMENSQYYARNGRSWSGYSYLVPHQWNGKYKTLKVIGDKKGGGTTGMLHRHPELLHRLTDTFPLRHKFIHVLRNPFDSITTLSLAVKKEIKPIFQLFTGIWKEMPRLKQSIPPGDLFELRHEECIAAPKQWLTRLCEFLGQDIPPGYLEDCASIVKSEPSKSRFKVSWSPEDIAAVEEEIKRHSFLAGYSYHS